MPQNAPRQVNPFLPQSSMPRTPPHQEHAQNVIGNVDDGPVLPDKEQAQQAGEQPLRSPMYPDGGGDQLMFTPIAPVRTEAQIARMASRRGKSKERPPQQ